MKNLIKTIAGVLLGILIYAALNAAIRYNNTNQIDLETALKDLPWAGFMIAVIVMLIYEYGFKSKQKEEEKEKQKES
ncbi:MAG: hypothetical protein ACRCSQ_04355 [Bacteroidales bacterium]